MQRFVRLRVDGVPTWARVDGDKRLALSDAPWADPKGLHEVEGDILAPATPTKIVCIGRNYAAHAKELGNEVPKTPLLFLKPPSSLIASGEAILLPAESERVEHEGELAAVIGKELRDGSEEDARTAVFGWTTANDVTARDIQRADVQFTRGKGFDTFCPLGPSITTELDVSALMLRVHVDGELRQEGCTDAMVWSPYPLIAYISNIMTLMPGDVVLTGTPAGVAPLKPGDTVRVEIDGLEALESPVEARTPSKR